MHRVELTYALRAAGEARRELHHPLIALLGAIHHQGSISAAARHLGLSYRHVWGELKRWERELGHTLVLWTKGQPARLAPFGSKLLWAERRAQARLAPQFDAIRAELERAFGVAFDDGAEVIEVAASHDEGLRSLSTWAATHWKLHLDIRFSGSVDALSALNEGRAIVAGFHALKHARARSITARAYRPMLRPGHHKLIGFATRQQGLMVASGNPLAITGLRDLARGGVRFVNREPGTGTRLVLEELLADAGVDLRAIDGQEHVEPSHRAVAEAVASGRPTRRSASRPRPGHAGSISCRWRKSTITWRPSPIISSARRCWPCAPPSLRRSGKWHSPRCPATRPTAAAKYSHSRRRCLGGTGRHRSGEWGHARAQVPKRSARAPLPAIDPALGHHRLRRRRKGLVMRRGKVRVESRGVVVELVQEDQPAPPGVGADVELATTRLVVARARRVLEHQGHEVVPARGIDGELDRHDVHRRAS